MPFEGLPPRTLTANEKLLAELNSGQIERGGQKTERIEAGEGWEVTYNPTFRVLQLIHEFDRFEISFTEDGVVRNRECFDRNNEIKRSEIDPALDIRFMQKAIELIEAGKVPLPTQPQAKAA